jgi:hypothetical protein
MGVASRIPVAGEGDRREAESSERSYRIAAEGLGAAILGNILVGFEVRYPRGAGELEAMP